MDQSRFRGSRHASRGFPRPQQRVTPHSPEPARELEEASKQHGQIPSTKPDQAEAVRKTTKHKVAKPFRRPYVFYIGSAVCLLLIALGIGWKIYQQRNSPITTPFTPSVMASVQFPLYYPTNLPADYHIDKKSVTEPQAGEVVVFVIKGPHNAKLYISEEARPRSFDIGGFFEQLSHLKEIGVSDGAIAVGYKGTSHTLIGSRINNKVWTIANTNAPLSPGSMTTLLKSLTVSY